MAETPTFEEMMIKQTDGSMPDKLKLKDFNQDTQYTMQEVKNLNDRASLKEEPPITSPEPTDATYVEKKASIIAMLNELKDQKGSLTKLSQLIDSLYAVVNNKRTRFVTSETHPYIMREIRIALKENAEPLFQSMRDTVLNQISRHDNNSAPLLNYLRDWLLFMKENKVDVDDIVEETKQALTSYNESPETTVNGMRNAVDRFKDLY